MINNQNTLHCVLCLLIIRRVDYEYTEIYNITRLHKQFPPLPIASKVALPSPRQEPVLITAPCSVSNTPSTRLSEAGETGWPLCRIGPHAFTKCASPLQKQLLLLIYTCRYKETTTRLVNSSKCGVSSCNERTSHYIIPTKLNILHTKSVLKFQPTVNNIRQLILFSNYIYLHTSTKVSYITPGCDEHRCQIHQHPIGGIKCQTATTWQFFPDSTKFK